LNEYFHDLSFSKELDFQSLVSTSMDLAPMSSLVPHALHGLRQIAEPQQVLFCTQT